MSETAILYACPICLSGLRDHGLSHAIMRQAVAEFFFMASLTGRYSSSPGPGFEADLARLGEGPTGAAFAERLRDLSRTALTADTWSITLPDRLATSGTRTPALMACEASLVLLDARALFRSMKVASLTGPSTTALKSRVERHHLFPRAYLEGLGVKDVKRITQIANFAFIEWGLNNQIGKQAPSAYAPALDAALSATARDEAHFWHALPKPWWTLGYEDLLRQRRELMARVIERAWTALTSEAGPVPLDHPAVDDPIRDGETDGFEFKGALRTNLHAGQADERMHLAALRSVAAFLDAKGAPSSSASQCRSLARAPGP